MSTIRVVVRTVGNDESKLVFNAPYSTPVQFITAALNRMKKTTCRYSLLIGGTTLLPAYTFGFYKDTIEEFKVIYAVEERQTVSVQTQTTNVQSQMKKLQVQQVQPRPWYNYLKVKADMLRTRDEINECTRLIENVYNKEVRASKAESMFKKMMEEHENRTGEPLTDENQIADLRKECRVMTNHLMNVGYLNQRKAQLEDKYQKLESQYYHRE